MRRAKMGKYLKKRTANRELVAMEATEVSSKRRKTEVAAKSEEFVVSYLQLRSRRVCMSSQIERSRKFAGSRISHCNSSTCCEVATASPSTCFPEHGGQFDTTTRYAPGGDTGDNARNREPKVEANPTKRTATVVATTPSEAEIEEFFVAAERNQRQLFSNKYNFDVGNDVPLGGGRYEWVPLLVIR